MFLHFAAFRNSETGGSQHGETKKNDPGGAAGFDRAVLHAAAARSGFRPGGKVEVYDGGASADEPQTQLPKAGAAAGGEFRFVRTVPDADL